MDPSHPLWIRVLLRIAARRATDAELGDIVEDYVETGRRRSWLVSQIFSIVQRRRSHLTMSERGAEMLSNVWNDIRYTLRTLGRNPGFALAAIVPIALGIGINTGVFSIVNSVAWRALPVPEPEALVSIHQDFRGGPRRMVNGARSQFSFPEYRAYRDDSHTLAGLMAYSRRWDARRRKRSRSSSSRATISTSSKSHPRSAPDSPLPIAMRRTLHPGSC